MSEELRIELAASKEEKYRQLLPQLESLISEEPDLVANLANISAALQQSFGWLWVGFYMVMENDELVLGPFQGPVACTRIKKGKGVCGTAWQESRSILVPDVNQFPGHIACSSLSVSELVVPLFTPDNTVAGVLDVDTEKAGILDETDQHYLEKVADLFRWKM
jgi:L-methionine (R)-S-oxide reductase